jgi:cathepsin L
MHKQDEDKCKYTVKNRGATMSSYIDIKQGSEPDLQVAVGTVGPISVAIDASSLSFQVEL